MKHTGLTLAAALAGATLVLSGCDDSTGGIPKAGVGITAPSTSTPTSTSRRTTGNPATPTTTSSAPTAPDAQELAPQNGYVFIATKSGKTRCQISSDQVGCESDFTDAPQVEGESANGVRINAAGELHWVVGNLGDIPTVPIDYRTYSALGWTIAATPDGTRFTNRASGHGMYLSTSEVKAF